MREAGKTFPSEGLSELICVADRLLLMLLEDA